MKPNLASWLALATGLLLLAPAAAAPHLYRGTGGGCSPLDGWHGDPIGPGTAYVKMLHNSYLDATTKTPLTVIAAGGTVTWEWSSAHCHSATGGLPGAADGTFDTGFHYPIAAPITPQLLPGLVEYPVPAVGMVVAGPVVIDTGFPTLLYTATFDTPGAYVYFCVHHYNIGMVGVVLVQ